jgi:DNA-binding PadR family transcriptional regulator
MAPISSAAVEKHLPLKPAVFHVLLALVDQEAHGYALRQAVLEQSSGRVRLATGPFYRYLGKILDLGLVKESERRPADDDVRRGSYYRLTPLGRAVLKAESARLAGVVSISKKLGLLPGAGAK